MSDAEDDYLSDKFLAQTSAPSSSSKPLTYAERRRRAQREAEIKNEQNRKKSRRQLEDESTREGLSKSLFERAKEEEETGVGAGNKAMAMMMKMGFKPGQSLGKIEDHAPKPAVASDEIVEPAPSVHAKTSGHLVEPLPIDVWSGRQGLGKRKRAVSPAVAEKLARVVKQAAEDEAHGSFRDRARQEYEERRAEGRLTNATRTCITLDEKAGKAFNVLWLNPQDPESFPPELLDSLTADPLTAEAIGPSAESERLRQQMRADALHPLPVLDDDTQDPLPESKTQLEVKRHFSQAIVDDANNFIRMNAQDRLGRLLGYLRDEYFYCFWCGTQYTDLQDLNNGCPGLDEEAHD